MGAKWRFAWSRSPGRSRLQEGSEGRSLKGQEELNDRGEGLSDSHVGGTAKPVTHVSQIRDVKWWIMWQEELSSDCPMETSGPALGKGKG